MKHTEMPSGYEIPARSGGDYESVATAYANAKASDNLPEGGRAGFYGVIYSHVECAWAVADLKLLGFHCVTATLDDFWRKYLMEGMDQDLITMRRAKR
jgi:hypothetical protein